MQEWIRSNEKWRSWSAHNIRHSFFKRSRAANSVVGDGIWQKIKLSQAFIIVLVTCKNDVRGLSQKVVDFLYNKILIWSIAIKFYLWTFPLFLHYDAKL